MLFTDFLTNLLTILVRASCKVVRLLSCKTCSKVVYYFPQMILRPVFRTLSKSVLSWQVRKQSQAGTASCSTLSTCFWSTSIRRDLEAPSIFRRRIIHILAYAFFYDITGIWYSFKVLGRWVETRKLGWRQCILTTAIYMMTLLISWQSWQSWLF